MAGLSFYSALPEGRILSFFAFLVSNRGFNTIPVLNTAYIYIINSASVFKGTLYSRFFMRLVTVKVKDVFFVGWLSPLTFNVAACFLCGLSCFIC